MSTKTIPILLSGGCNHEYFEVYNSTMDTEVKSCLSCGTISEPERLPLTCRGGFTLPDDIRRTIDAYVAHGTRPGSCLTACIDNNLSLAVGRADDEHLAAIPAIVGYLFERCDMRCWGHANACEDWIAKKSRDRLLRRAATQVEAENFL